MSEDDDVVAALFEGGRELSGSDDRRLLTPVDATTLTDPSVGSQLYMFSEELT